MIVTESTDRVQPPATSGGTDISIVRGEFTSYEWLDVLSEPGAIATGLPQNWLLIKREDKFADIDWKLKPVLPV